MRDLNNLNDLISDNIDFILKILKLKPKIRLNQTIIIKIVWNMNSKNFKLGFCFLSLGVWTNYRPKLIYQIHFSAFWEDLFGPKDSSL